MSRLWDKGHGVEERILRYTVGDDHRLDERLVPHDVRGSIAHARMLAERGHLTSEEAEAIAHALEEIQRAHAEGEWRISLEEEDAHTALESRLVERLGETGKKIHLGRSRNDQVLTALRLYLLDEVAGLRELGSGVSAALATLADEQGDTPLPGYTHLQRAMPSSVRLWAEGYRSEIEDDLAGLAATRRRLSRNPLGSAAGYGVPVIDLDRDRTRELLGFDEVQEPVTAVQLSRGKGEAHVLFEIALLLQDLGRLAADLCLFATQEFGFVRLPEEMTTGSSIMPQKRNPDVFELIRGHGAQASADLLAVLNVTNGLPSGYHRDLQLIKAPLFRSLDVARDTLEILAFALPRVSFDAGRAAAALDPSLFATEKAYRLVQETGIPFREAYRQVAGELERRPERD